MANQLATFEETEPELKVQNVNSRAEGFEAFAKAFGNVSNKAVPMVEKIETEKSNAMFMQSANQADQLKTQAQIDMMRNPNNADEIAKNANYTYDTIKKSAFVNQADRDKLNYVVDRSMDDVKFKAAQTSFDQAKRGIAIKFWDSYPVTMRQIEQALDRSDLPTAKALEDALHSNSLAAAQIGAITPEQVGTVRKSSLNLYEKTHDLLELSQRSEGVTAQEYHAAYMSPFGTNSFDNIGHPGDANTQWMTQHLNSDRTLSGQFTALWNGQPINYSVVANASDQEYQKFKMSMAGVNQVKGALSAGTPFNQIEARMAVLESKPTLNAMETGELSYWKSFKNRLGSDNSFYGLMGMDVMAAQYTAEHQAQAEALMASGKKGPELNEALRLNDNNYIGQMVDRANGRALDPNYVKPIPSAWAAEVRSGFQKGAPVLPALDRIAYVNREFRGYLAETMPKPHQAVAVWLAGETMGFTDTSFQADLIHANQDKVDPLTADNKNQDKSQPASSLLLSGSEDVATKANNVWNDVVNANDNMKDLFAYFGKLPGGSTTQDGFRSVAVNYIYDQAQRSGDVELTNKNQYVDSFVKNTLRGYNLYRNDRAFLNLNDLQLNRTQDADHIVNYALSEAYKRIHAGRSEAEFQSYIDINPLMVVSTPDRRLVVVDRYGRAAVTNDGHEAFDMPYTSNMLSAAQKRSSEVQDYLHNYGYDKEFKADLSTISPQAVMVHNHAVHLKAQEAKRNEEALMRAKQGDNR